MAGGGGGAFANIPPGVLAELHFGDLSTLSPQIHAVTITFIALVSLIVVARLSVRVFVVGKIFSDDSKFTAAP